MKALINLFSILLLSYNISNAQQKLAEFPKLTGPYLGQKSPGNNPVLFAPGIVSTGNFEHSSPVFSKDLKEIYWTANIEKNKRFITRSTFVMKCDNGVWSKPRIPAFCKDFPFCENPFITPSGNKIFFAASKNMKPDKNEPVKMDIYYAERTETGWSNPINLGGVINTPTSDAIGPSASQNGTLFFRYDDKSNPSFKGLSFSNYKNGKYSLPILMDEKFRKSISDYTPYIAPDESYFIFASFRPGGYGMGDLYISFKQSDGSWGDVKNMGNRINGVRNERFPNLSPDGKYLFFNSSRRIRGAYVDGPGNGSGDMYWVSSKIIDYLKNEDLDIITQLYCSFIDNGYESVIEKFNLLKIKHSEFYDFDKSVLYDLCMRLIKINRNTEAIKILSYNSKLFPKSNLIIQHLLISLLENNDTEYNRLSVDLVQRNQKEKLLYEDELNNLGYKILSANLVNKSICLFVLNTKLFPESSNAYNSLAEAYEKGGNIELAVENHEKSLEINPENVHSIDALKRIKEKNNK